MTRPEKLPVPTWAAKLGCQGALGRQVGLQSPLGLPSWTAKAPMDAILGSNLASKCLSRAPRTSKFARQYGTLATFSEIPVFGLHMLLDCFLAALGAFWDASWAPFGLSWAPLGLNLAPHGHIWGSSWRLWGALGAHLGASWVPLGLHLGLLGASSANLGPSGHHMASKWT